LITIKTLLGNVRFSAGSGHHPGPY